MKQRDSGEPARPESPRDPPTDSVAELDVPYVPSRGPLARNWHRLDPVDQAIASFMDRIGIRLLRISLAVVFIWFGALKLVDMSPAHDLIRDTVTWVPFDIFYPILGVWEVLIGIFLLYRPTIRIAILLLFLQMPGTALPLFVLPEVTFTSFPFGLTLEGQYIIKNLTLVAAAMVVGGTARVRSRDGHRLV